MWGSRCGCMRCGVAHERGIADPLRAHVRRIRIAYTRVGNGPPVLPSSSPQHLRPHWQATPCYTKHS